MLLAALLAFHVLAHTCTYLVMLSHAFTCCEIRGGGSSHTKDWRSGSENGAVFG